MAAVYLAYDPNFRRNVAIKVVSVNFRDNVIFRGRFEREAQLIAKIEHPAIVPVYDFGEQDNQPYLVMRYMPGGSLAARVKHGALTFRDAAQIISQIAPALDAVHAQGIVHRDLKPGNILFDGFGNPAISDFGIAHFSAATSDLTGSAIIGTPSYMSPEQVRGDADLDGRSDVYALGVILFEMLAGHGPFHAGTPMSVALKHLSEPVPSIRAFRPDLPMDVERILNRAMAKDRTLRYPNASELALDLGALLDTFPDDRTPAPIPGRPAHGAERPTEIDVEESSEPALVPSSALHVRPADVIRPVSISPSSKPVTGTGRSSRRMLQIAALAGVGLFLFFLCGSLGLLGTWARFGLPGFFSGTEQTAVPTPAATQTSHVQEILLFADDFSDPLSGWPTREGYSYRQDGYHIAVHEPGGVPWARTSMQFDNASLYVDARPVTEGINGYYGLLCRIQDAQNFYYLVVRNDGGYTIGKYKNAEFQSLVSEGWQRNDAIYQGNQTNRLKADCVGNTLRFSVNDVLLGEVSDTDFSSGFGGIVAAATDAPGFEVIFNDFRVTRPAP